MMLKITAGNLNDVEKGKFKCSLNFDLI